MGRGIKQYFFVFVFLLATFATPSVPTFAQEQNGITEADPLFGFEIETRGPEGELVAPFNFPTLVAGILLLPLDTVTGLPIINTYLSVATSAIYPSLFQGSLRYPIQVAWIKHILKKRGISYSQASNRIINSETGFWIKPSTDVHVMETKTKPSTVEQLQDNTDFLDLTTFNRRTTLGVGGAVFFSSGHIHMDRATAFHENAQLLRDFVADFLNHPGLYLGPYVRDRVTSNDPRRSLGKIRKVIEDFDAGLISSIEQLALRFQSAGLSRNSFTGPALTFSRIQTLEFRFPRAFKNAGEMVLWAQLFKARLNYLLKNPGVELKPFQLFRTPTESYRQIHAYVTEPGLEWEPYKKMLPRRWQWFVAPFAEKTACEATLSKQ